MSKQPTRVRTLSEPAPEPIDADAWAEKYVRALLEAERQVQDVAPAAVPALRYAP